MTLTPFYALQESCHSIQETMLNGINTLSNTSLKPLIVPHADPCLHLYPYLSYDIRQLRLKHK